MTKRTTLALMVALAALAAAPAAAPAYNVFAQYSVGEPNGNGAYNDTASDVYDRVGGETVLVAPSSVAAATY